MSIDSKRKTSKTFSLYIKDAEIQVGAGDVMAKRRIKFPSKGSPQDDHIEFPPSVFESAGNFFLFQVVERYTESRRVAKNFCCGVWEGVSTSSSLCHNKFSALEKCTIPSYLLL